jgi:hypothetical protein
VRVDNLPTDGLSDLRVAIDLMGAGDVWLDSVQVYDLWFDKTELNELIKMTALANFCLGKGAVVDCHRMLSGYWPEFLRRHVSPDDPDLVAAPLTGTPPPASGNPPPAAPAAAGGTAAEQPPASTSWLQRLVPKTPRIPNPFR